MIKKELTLLSFDELSDEQKEKVIESNRYVLVEFDTWDDWILDGFVQDLQEEGYLNVKPFYDISYSQGSGACFDADIDLMKWLEASKRKEHYAKLLPFIERDEIGAKILTNDNHYCHEKTRYVEIYDETSSDQERPDDVLLDELEKELEDDRLDRCKSLYKALTESYEDETSDETIGTHLSENGYLFRSDTLEIESMN